LLGKDLQLTKSRERERERERERVWKEVGDLGFGVWSWTSVEEEGGGVGFEEPRERGGKKKEIGCVGGGVGRDLDDRFILRGF
jgi:hypothetical protein